MNIGETVRVKTVVPLRREVTAPEPAEPARRVPARVEPRREKVEVGADA